VDGLELGLEVAADGIERGNEKGPPGIVGQFQGQDLPHRGAVIARHVGEGMADRVPESGLDQPFFAHNKGEILTARPADSFLRRKRPSGNLDLPGAKIVTVDQFCGPLLQLTQNG